MDTYCTETFAIFGLTIVLSVAHSQNIPLDDLKITSRDGYFATSLPCNNKNLGQCGMLNNLGQYR